MNVRASSLLTALPTTVKDRHLKLRLSQRLSITSLLCTIPVDFDKLTLAKVYDYYRFDHIYILYRLKNSLPLHNVQAEWNRHILSRCMGAWGQTWWLPNMSRRCNDPRKYTNYKVITFIMNELTFSNRYGRWLLYYDTIVAILCSKTITPGFCRGL